MFEFIFLSYRLVITYGIFYFYNLALWSWNILKVYYYYNWSKKKYSISIWIGENLEKIQYIKVKNKKKVEISGIDPDASRMGSCRQLIPIGNYADVEKVVARNTIYHGLPF